MNNLHRQVIASSPRSDNSNRGEEDASQSYGCNDVGFLSEYLRLSLFHIYLTYWIPKQLLLFIWKYAKVVALTVVINPIIFIWIWITDSFQLRVSSWRPLLILAGILFLGRIKVNSSQQPTADQVSPLSQLFPTSSSPFYVEGLTIPSGEWPEEKEETPILNVDSFQRLLYFIKSTVENNNIVFGVLTEEAKKARKAINSLKSNFETEITTVWSRLTDQQTYMETVKEELWSELDRRRSFFLNNYQQNHQTTNYRKMLHRNIEEAYKKYRSSDMAIIDRFEDQFKGPRFSTQALVELLTDKVFADDKFDGSLETVINRHIQKYHQDVLNSADFALISRGARILHSKTSATYHLLPAWKQGILQMIGLTPTVENVPEMAISQQSHAGECWSMYGNEGTLGILLSEPIHIESVTVEYPSREVMLESMHNAPKDILLYGYPYSHNKKSNEPVFLGAITYDIHKEENSAIQTFDISNHDYPEKLFYAVQIKILSNWGNPGYTDIYRIRIHGVPPKVSD